MSDNFLTPPSEVDDWLSVDPSTWSPRDLYHLNSALVTPRPIAWVSTQSSQGHDNLAPHSYFNMVCDDPPILMFSIEGKSDTYHNLRELPEMVVNLVTLDLAEAMETTAVNMPPEEDEFVWAGLEKAPSTKVKPARVALAQACMECVLERLEAVGRKNYLVLAKVVRYHINGAVWHDARVDPTAYRVFGRLAGQYGEMGRRFKMRRPAFSELEAGSADDKTALSRRVPADS